MAIEVYIKGQLFYWFPHPQKIVLTENDDFKEILPLIRNHHVAACLRRDLGVYRTKNTRRKKLELGQRRIEALKGTCRHERVKARRFEHREVFGLIKLQRAINMDTIELEDLDIVEDQRVKNSVIISDNITVRPRYNWTEWRIKFLKDRKAAKEQQKTLNKLRHIEETSGKIAKSDLEQE